MVLVLGTPAPRHRVVRTLTAHSLVAWFFRLICGVRDRRLFSSGRDVLSIFMSYVRVGMSCAGVESYQR